MSGLPRELELGSEEVRRAIDAPLADIMTAIHDTLEETPPELAADIARHGILLAGGGALLRGFSERVHRETGMPVPLADAPLTCVATGAGRRWRSWIAWAGAGSRSHYTAATGATLRAPGEVAEWLKALAC